MKRALRLEKALIARMREEAPDQEIGDSTAFDIAVGSQTLRAEKHEDASPHILERLLRSIENDGRDRDGGRGNIRLRKLSSKTLEITLQRSWQVIERTADIRWQAANILLTFLINKVETGTRGKDIQVDTTLGELLAELNNDALLKGTGIKDMTKLMERALMWLHEQRVLSLGKGLRCFVRP